MGGRTGNVHCVIHHVHTPNPDLLLCVHCWIPDIVLRKQNHPRRRRLPRSNGSLACAYKNRVDHPYSTARTHGSMDSGIPRPSLSLRLSRRFGRPAARTNFGLEFQGSGLNVAPRSAIMQFARIVTQATNVYPYLDPIMHHAHTVAIHLQWC